MFSTKKDFLRIWAFQFSKLARLKLEMNIEAEIVIHDIVIYHERPLGFQNVPYIC